jgi:polyribonucleotide nucleotidyltransferase
MQRIQVPPSSIKLIRGKNGINIKEIERRSGVKCNINGNNYVEITGSHEARNIAYELIQVCIKNSIAVYNHPVIAKIALRHPLVGLESINFVKYQGIVDLENINKAYHVLDLDKAKDMVQVDTDNDISSLLENLSLKYGTVRLSIIIDDLDE